MVDAAPERQVRALAAPDIEPPRALEHFGVPVGGADQDKEIVALAHRESVHLAIGEHAPDIRL